MALGSMYDYLVKFILIGPSGCGKYASPPSPGCTAWLIDGRSCLLHRFLRDEWKSLSSHTIGVEFANKIVKLGTGTRRKRMKLQV
jgi:Ras-related protein Rab-4B